MDKRAIFTIGHSNIAIEGFLALLRRHGITVVSDVRSHPYSRYLPHFNGPALKAALRAAGIGYVFLGRELGARPEDPSCYVDNTAAYEKIAATALFAEGLDRVRKGMGMSTIALTCAEKDPLICHRAILVCRHLRAPGLAINHILPDGSLEAHEELEQRLLREHKLQQTSFLTPSSPDDLLEEAYNRQAERIAYRKPEAGRDDDEHAEAAY